MSDGNRAMDDIAFMRELAQDGQESPLRSGPVLLTSGLIFGVTSAGVWAASVAGMITSAWSYPGIYGVASVSFILALGALKRRTAVGGGSAANRATRIAWSAVGAAIWTVAIALMMIGWRSGDWRVMTAFPSIVFAIYGAAWMIAAFMSRLRWLWLVAIASFALALLLGWVAGDPMTLYGVFSGGIFAVVAAPGLALTLQARRG